MLQVLLQSLLRFIDVGTIGLLVVAEAFQLLRLLDLEVDAVGLVDVAEGFAHLFEDVEWCALDEAVVESTTCSTSDLLNLVFLQLHFFPFKVSPFNTCKNYLLYVQIQPHPNCIRRHQVWRNISIELSCLLFSAFGRKSTVDHCNFWHSFSFLIQTLFLHKLIIRLALLFSSIELLLYLLSQVVQCLHWELYHAVALFYFAYLKNARNQF